jgi:protein O-GlcNAc transferase
MYLASGGGALFLTGLARALHALLHVQGKLDGAISAYQQAIAAQPHFPEAWNNLGNALREAGRAAEAITCYTRCIHLQMAAAQAQAPLLAGGGPGAAKLVAAQHAQRLSVAFNNLAGILKMTSRLAECIQCYEHVMYLQPQSPEAYANLASAYKDCGRHDEAISSYRQALSLRPSFPDAHANLVHSLQCVCEWGDRPQLFARCSGLLGGVVVVRCGLAVMIGSAVRLMCGVCEAAGMHAHAGTHVS